MLQVLFTVDVEVWCDGWVDIDARFPDAWRRYILGETPRGRYGLPLQLEMLGDHGLRGVFFVEPLHAARFSSDPLSQTVGMIREADQEVQLHLHTEWADEARPPLPPGAIFKRQHLRMFTLEEQLLLIEHGRTLLESAGAPEPTAFRAGSFGFNRDTLRALRALGIPFDSSYNAAQFGMDSGVFDGFPVVEPLACEGITEVPMTVFHDGTRSLRHTQLTACSASEIEGVLWRALEDGRQAVVLLSHGTELLTPDKSRPDGVAVARLRHLFRLLDRHRDCFKTCDFDTLDVRGAERPTLTPLRSPFWRTGGRMLEQAWRRIHP